MDSSQVLDSITGLWRPRYTSVSAVEYQTIASDNPATTTDTVNRVQRRGTASRSRKPVSTRVGTLPDDSAVTNSNNVSTICPLLRRMEDQKKECSRTCALLR